MSDNPLGQASDHPERYSPEFLCPVSRSDNRGRLGIDTGELPFHGRDIWRAYELSWVDGHDKPHVALAEFSFPCEAPDLIESKSLKLYLGSLNQERFDSSDAVRECIARDLKAACGREVQVTLCDLRQQLWSPHPLVGDSAILLDHLPVTIEHWHPRPSLLQADPASVVEETLCSDLFRSRCPVTGQPDWGSVLIRYRGPAIEHRELLRYLVSFRLHEGFHEDCVETVFMDLLGRCAPEELMVGIHFLRRGGLEINPYRWTAGMEEPVEIPRAIRQ